LAIADTLFAIIYVIIAVILATVFVIKMQKITHQLLTKADFIQTKNFLLGVFTIIAFLNVLVICVVLILLSDVAIYVGLLIAEILDISMLFVCFLFFEKSITLPCCEPKKSTTTTVPL